MPLTFEERLPDSPLEMPSLSALSVLDAFSVDAVLLARSSRVSGASPSKLRGGGNSLPAVASRSAPAKRRRSALNSTADDVMCCNACGEELPTKALTEHLRSRCGGRSVTCSNGCSWVGRYDDLKYHLDHDCKYTRKRERCYRSFKRKQGRTVPCPNGCGASLNGLQLSHHAEKECPLRLVECPAAGCAERVPLKLLDRHRREDCKFAQRRTVLAEKARAAALAKVSCTACGALLVGGKRALARHRKVCGARLVDCVYCGAQVELRRLKEHHASQCPYLRARARMIDRAKIGQPMVSCEWCNASIEPRKLASHLRSGQCEGRFVRCACGANVRSSDMEEHFRRDLFYGLFRASRCPIADNRAALARSAKQRAETALPCPLGCGESFMPKEMGPHKRVCAYRRRRCRLCRRAVPIGVKHDCPLADEDEARCRRAKNRRVIVECAYGCGERMPRRAMAAHSKICSFRLVKCEYCGCMIVLADADKHNANECAPSLAKAKIAKEFRERKGFDAPWLDTVEPWREDLVLSKAAAAVERAAGLL